MVNRATSAVDKVKLPPFWPDSPAAWFMSAEMQFQLRGITAQTDRFCLIAAALDKESLKRVMHVLSNPDPATPYDVLKEALVVSHQLNNFERVQLVLAMPPLGARKPSQLAADMLEACPKEEVKSMFLIGLFLQRLPRELRLLLGTEDHKDIRVLAARADQLIAYNRHQDHDRVAAINPTSETDAASDSTETVAAVRPFKPKGKQPGNNNKPDNTGEAPQLCYFHYRFGAKSRKCKQPCTWQGN